MNYGNSMTQFAEEIMQIKRLKVLEEVGDSIDSLRYENEEKINLLLIILDHEPYLLLMKLLI